MVIYFEPLEMHLTLPICCIKKLREADCLQDGQNAMGLLPFFHDFLGLAPLSVAGFTGKGKVTTAIPCMPAKSSCPRESRRGLFFTHRSNEASFPEPPANLTTFLTISKLAACTFQWQEDRTAFRNLRSWHVN